MGDFKKLHVWRKAHALALNADHVAATIRPRRHSSLRSQMSRAAMSIGANIVEGRGRNSEAESPATFEVPSTPRTSSNII
jgi:four helix bundle protein